MGFDNSGFDLGLASTIKVVLLWWQWSDSSMNMFGVASAMDLIFKNEEGDVHRKEKKKNKNVL